MKSTLIETITLTNINGSKSSYDVFSLNSRNFFTDRDDNSYRPSWGFYGCTVDKAKFAEVFSLIIVTWAVPKTLSLWDSIEALSLQSERNYTLKRYMMANYCVGAKNRKYIIVESTPKQGGHLND